MKDPRTQNAPKVKVAVKSEAVSSNVIIVSGLLLVLLLLVSGFSGT
ncbi:MAG: hypothetical protein HKN36_04410 [Hellea sp.]|nr:hypothetical protein [Hellea sp.]